MINIPKTNYRKSFVDPIPAWGKDKDNNIFIRCNCGKCINLSPVHTIDNDGNVSPSIFHNETNCGWHIYGKLMDWKNE
jgi:hypothetical protein